MRRFCQHRHRSEVNQAVVDGVSLSCLKSLESLSKQRFCQHGRQPDRSKPRRYRWQMMASALLV